jgi:hypothetical protein
MVRERGTEEGKEAGRGGDVPWGLEAKMTVPLLTVSDAILLLLSRVQE